MGEENNGSRESTSQAETATRRIRGMLMLGAADRRCGKTTLATRLVRAEAARRAVAGVKVTTVHDRKGAPCPRGNDGCGVCDSLEGPFALTEETGGAPGKDTTRLLEAGAAPVLWLCVRPGALVDGAAALEARSERRHAPGHYRL